MSDTKWCPRCEKEKPLSDFNGNTSRHDGLQGMCRICQREYDREYYYRSPRRRAEIRQRNAKQRVRARRHVRKYLTAHPCTDCGESDPIVLDFDHVSDKNNCISDMVRQGYSTQAIQAEIDKCEVRCANCHRRKTYYSRV